MEIKNKIAEELQDMISDFDVLDKELASSMPQTQPEMNMLNMPQNKGKKMRLAALNAKKIDLTYKINSLAYVLVNYFAMDVKAIIPEKLGKGLEEYDKMISNISIINKQIKYNEEFEDFFKKVEEVANK